MLFDELPLPFPFYDSKEKQVRFNVNTDEPCGALLISPCDALLPFQVKKGNSSELPLEVNICNAEDDSVFANVTSITAFLKAITLEGSDYLTYNGDELFPGGVALDMPPGEYYVSMEFSGDELWYSECFRVPLERFHLATPSECKFLKLEWSNAKDISPIHYNSNPGLRLQNRIYLDSIINNSEPEIEQEGTLNGDNELIPTFQKLTIKYRIALLVPDFLKLAISAIPLHDTVQLSTEFSKRIGQLTNVKTDSKPEATGGYFSDVDILFEQELALIKHGCGDAMSPGDCADIPADSMTLDEVPTGIEVTASLPGAMWANIYSYSIAGPPGFLSKANNYAIPLAAGVVVPWASLHGDRITLRYKSFNCDIGYSTQVQLSPPLAYHPYAMGFFHSIETDAGFISNSGTITGGEKTAINDFVEGAIAANIWGKIHAFHCFFTGYEDAQKYNLIDPRNLDAAFRLTFPLGYTPDPSGAIFTVGMGQYADTHYSPAAHVVNNKFFMMLNISNAVTTIDRGLCGSYDSAASQAAMLFHTGNNFEGFAFNNVATMAENFPSGQNGNYLMSRRSSVDATFYFNGNPDVNTTTSMTGTPPAANILIGAVNGLMGIGTMDNNINCFALGADLSDTEANALANLVSGLNTALGR